MSVVSVTAVPRWIQATTVAASVQGTQPIPTTNMRRWICRSSSRELDKEPDAYNEPNDPQGPQRQTQICTHKSSEDKKRCLAHVGGNRLAQLHRQTEEA